MFARGAEFFALDDKVKAAVPCDPATFVGWERDAEVSPATGGALVHLSCFLKPRVPAPLHTPQLHLPFQVI